MNKVTKNFHQCPYEDACKCIHKPSEKNCKGCERKAEFESTKQWVADCQWKSYY